MPGRILPLVNSEVYHVFNRGIDRRPTFITKAEYQRAIKSISFYRFAKPPLRLSKLLLLENKRQVEILESLEKSEKLVEIISYCLMPNHFHFLLKQTQENGISKFLGNFQNSYTRYFNTRNKRDGSLFLDQFKAVRIETDEQLIHVSRYIHLNPFTSFVVKSLDDLKKFPYSSLHNYLSNDQEFIEIELILDFFANPNLYQQFIFDQADYQRRLKEIEHLTIE